MEHHGRPADDACDLFIVADIRALEIDRAPHLLQVRFPPGQQVVDYHDLAGSLVPGTNILDGSDGASDPNGHGTAMAGIIAATTDNATGIAGIGYAGVKVMPVTVLDAQGIGQDSDIIDGNFPNALAAFKADFG